MAIEWSDFLRKGEQREVQYYNEQHEIVYLIITKNKFRDKYYLLDVSEGRRKEIASSSNPILLEKKMKKFR